MGFSSMVLLFYLAAAVTGKEIFGTPRRYVPDNVRQTNGGYRSFHYWHSGYRGGK